jgi:hypothetical protein
MIGFYNWLICKLFKHCAIYSETPTEWFKHYCEENPDVAQCQIYED